VRGRAVEDVLNRLGQTSRCGNEPRKMGVDDSDNGTGDSVGCVMPLGEVVGSVADSRKELGGDEGGLFGRAGGGWRLVVGEAEQLRQRGRGWGARDWYWLEDMQYGM